MVVKKGREEILSYLEDSSNFRQSQAESLYLPENEAEVVEVVQECVREKIPLTVSGGGTGTVGGRVARDGAIISLEKLNQVISIQTQEKKARLQAGVVITNFLEELEKYDLFYPPFPTERSAFIGGNVATNASGEYSFRFGSTRRYVQSLRMVLTTGEIIELERGKFYERNGFIPLGHLKVPLPSYRTPQIKCTAGYYIWPGMDAIDLIIGSEGTLGIITEISVNLIEKPPPRFIMVMFLPDDIRLLELVKLIKTSADLSVYSLEYFCPGALSFLQNDFPEIPEGTFALYVEAESTESQIERWISITEEFRTVQTIIGDDSKNYRRLIEFRHKLPENVNRYFRQLGIIKVAADIAVPEESFPGQYQFYRQIMQQEKIQTILFGHIGENHLHFNFFPKTEEEREKAYQLYESCARRAISVGGTIAAEHGIGKIKHRWLELMFGRKGLREMAAIKKMLDPACLLGLDNIFPRQLLACV